MDAPLPGIGAWDDIIRDPRLWHFNFRGPDVERLVAGRERIYLDRFWNELSANPGAIDEATASTTRRSMPGPGPCMTPSSSSAPSRRTRSTTRRSLKKSYGSSSTRPGRRSPPTVRCSSASSTSLRPVPGFTPWRGLRRASAGVRARGQRDAATRVERRRVGRKPIRRRRRSAATRAGRESSSATGGSALAAACAARRPLAAGDRRNRAGRPEGERHGRKLDRRGDRGLRVSVAALRRVGRVRRHPGRNGDRLSRRPRRRRLEAAGRRHGRRRRPGRRRPASAMVSVAPLSREAR